MQRIRLFVVAAERTQYAQELLDQMAKVDHLYNHACQLIEKVRCTAQPNKSHRTEDNLLPESEEYAERMRLSNSIRDAAKAAFADNAAMFAYMKNMADAQRAIYKNQDKFWRQVQAFCIKDLKKFTEQTYVAIKKAFGEMQSGRDAYDLARHNLKNCQPEEIEERGKAASAAQLEFEKKAAVLHELLLKMPDNQLAVAKACYLYIRAETDFARKIVECSNAIASPERQARGGGSPPEKTVVLEKRPLKSNVPDKSVMKTTMIP